MASVAEGHRRWGKRPAEAQPAATLQVAAPVLQAAAGTIDHASITVSSRRDGKGRGAGRVDGKGRGQRTSTSFTSGPFGEGLKAAYAARYAADLKRLQARPDLPAAARWIDSHMHLESILQRTWRGGSKPAVTDHEASASLEDLVASWPSGLDGCISNFAFRCPSKPGSLPEWNWLEANLHHFEPESPLASKLWFTIGIHPHDAGNWDAAAEATVRRLARHPKCVGIGECGLDLFKHDKLVLQRQLAAFRAQAQLAVDLRKALVVHARLVTSENEALFFRHLQELVPTEHPIHMHCYGDSLENALALCARWPRLRIGFTGAITFKDRPDKGKGKKGKGGLVEKKGQAHCQELVCGLPLDRLLIETDGPYMCPDPFRGQTAHPGHVHRVAEKIAEWKRCPLGEVMAATRASTAVVYVV